MSAFQHEALIYDGPEGFAAAALPFIQEGLEAEEPVLVAVGLDRIAMLRGALGPDAGDVSFLNMAEIGRNPGRIIPAWHDFLDERQRPGGAIRGIGEPIWAGRSPDELVECQLHESLLNVAFADAKDFRLLCPYDAGALDSAVIHEACCSHPIVSEDGTDRTSQSFRNGDLLAPFEGPLAPPRAPVELLAFDRRTLDEVRRTVSSRGESAGLDSARTQDFVLAVDEAAVNSVRHGGGNGILRLWREDDRLVCEVKDRGRITDPLVGRKRPGTGQLGGWGVFIAHQLCDLVQLRSGDDGTVVRLHMHVA